MVVLALVHHLIDLHVASVLLNVELVDVVTLLVEFVVLTFLRKFFDFKQLQVDFGTLVLLKATVFAHAKCLLSRCHRLGWRAEQWAALFTNAAISRRYR